MVEIAIEKKLRTATGAMQLRVEAAFATGELVGLYGHSGAGKTSILRMLAGLMKPDNGYIRFGDVSWYEAASRVHMLTQERRIGFVFQDYALFPNMNVRENIAYGIRQPADKSLADELLELMGLTGFAGSPVQSLSGGQRQRVALARAIASKPALLLLDEPLSAIDNALRPQLQDMLLEMHRRFQLTTILISHDVDEIVRLADRVWHLDNGVLQSYSNPSAFFYNSTRGVRELVADTAPGLTGRVLHIDEQQVATVLLHERMIKVNAADSGIAAGEDAAIFYDEATPFIRKL
jgi:molybdate transport system ATP-binding protein